MLTEHNSRQMDNIIGESHFLEFTIGLTYEGSSRFHLQVSKVPKIPQHFRSVSIGALRIYTKESESTLGVCPMPRPQARRRRCYRSEKSARGDNKEAPCFNA